MTKEKFIAKHGINIDTFFDIYLYSFDSDPNKLLLWNPAKLLRLCRDLPIKLLKDDFPDEFRILKQMMTCLETRIEEAKKEGGSYFKHQIKPYL